MLSRLCEEKVCVGGETLLGSFGHSGEGEGGGGQRKIEVSYMYVSFNCCPPSQPSADKDQWVPASLPACLLLRPVLSGFEPIAVGHQIAKGLILWLIQEFLFLCQACLSGGQ